MAPFSRGLHAGKANERPSRIACGFVTLTSRKKKRLVRASFYFLEVRGVEPLSKITSMSIPTSFPFAFKISPCPRPRRSAQISASLVNLGTYPQAWQIPIPYFVRTFIPMGAERGPALPLIRQRVRSFRQHLFFFRLFYECPRLRPRLATNTSVTLSKPEHPRCLTQI